ncbi:MAG: acyl-CoA thioesterase [Vicinamibacteria bacterium]|jgi:acyl-CoA thioester hydrolase|nr:acyl-CoA thioesterase [Vicinamibacteria bacterium]
MSASQAVETTFFVRYAETDQMGVVHHSSYIVWFEEGRSAWMRALGSNYADFEALGFNLSVAEVYAKYLAPARYGRQVTIRTWTEDVRSRAVTIRYEVLDTETRQLLVAGHTRHVCVDHQKKVTRLPEKWRRFFAQDGVEPSDTL